MNKKLCIPGLLVVTLTSCSDDMATDEQAVAPAEAVSPEVTQSSVQEDANPFFTVSSLFMKYPPFDQIEDEHYLPAFEAGMAEEL
ncbi:MAG: hypothetical protein ACR2QQ_00505, partial [Gammaproteobacteria bacterium]